MIRSDRTERSPGAAAADRPRGASRWTGSRPRPLRPRPLRRARAPWRPRARRGAARPRPRATGRCLHDEARNFLALVGLGLDRARVNDRARRRRRRRRRDRCLVHGRLAGPARGVPGLPLFAVRAPPVLPRFPHRLHRRLHRAARAQRIAHPGKERAQAHEAPAHRPRVFAVRPRDDLGVRPGADARASGARPSTRGRGRRSPGPGRRSARARHRAAIPVSLSPVLMSWAKVAPGRRGTLPVPQRLGRTAGTAASACRSRSSVVDAACPCALAATAEAFLSSKGSKTTASQSRPSRRFEGAGKASVTFLGRSVHPHRVDDILRRAACALRGARRPRGPFAPHGRHRKYDSSSSRRTNGPPLPRGNLTPGAARRPVRRSGVGSSRNGNLGELTETERRRVSTASSDSVTASTRSVRTRWAP